MRIHISLSRSNILIQEVIHPFKRLTIQVLVLIAPGSIFGNSKWSQNGSFQSCCCQFRRVDQPRIRGRSWFFSDSKMSSQSRQQKISTSTPKSSSKKCSKIVKTGENSSGDESSATLRSLLGVSPVSVKPSTSPAKPGGGRRKLKEKEELLKNMVNQAKEREASRKRGSMNSSVNTLSLQEENSFK